MTKENENVAKLNQILAIEAGQKTRVEKEVTQAYQVLAKPEPFAGLIRTYRPRDEEGQTEPDERKYVQLTAEDLIGVVVSNLADLWDTTATKDWANQLARADVVLDDGTLLLQDVPVPFLLFLEKQLTNLHTFVSKLPILDPAYRWELDESSGTGVWSHGPVESNKTKKAQTVLVKYPATVEHPAQTEVVTEDVVVGYWNATYSSGAVPAARRQELVDRVRRLQRAVKFAREEANLLDVEQKSVAEAVFQYVFRA